MQNVLIEEVNGTYKLYVLTDGYKHYICQCDAILNGQPNQRFNQINAEIIAFALGNQSANCEIACPFTSSAIS